jgi:molecular chaperone DnaK (HSP70)
MSCTWSAIEAAVRVAVRYAASTGAAKMLPNMDGDLTTPSIISLAGDRVVVGRAAKQDKFLDPERIAELYKRYMHVEPPPSVTAHTAALLR